MQEFALLCFEDGFHNSRIFSLDVILGEVRGTKGDSLRLIVAKDIFRVLIRKGDRKSRHLSNIYIIGPKMMRNP